VAANGIDGPTPEQSNESHDPNSTNTVPEASHRGTWAEEVDIRPTMLHLLGLHDDYATDGQVVSQVLSHPSKSQTDVQALGAAYRQINSSVGLLATITLQADSRALASGSATHDRRFAETETALRKIANRRDSLATGMKALLARADAGHKVRHGQVQDLLSQARALLRKAAHLD